MRIGNSNRSVIWRGIGIAIAVLLPLTSTSACQADDEKTNFATVGAMKAFLPEGKTPGKVAGGLPFSIVLTDSGKTISGGTFSLKLPGTEKSIQITFLGLTYANGHLNGQVQVKDTAGSSIEGLRLDVEGATETYKAKDAQGLEVIKTRSQNVSLASPLLFGDLKEEESNAPLPMSAGPLSFAPETMQIAVLGKLSGLLYVQSLSFPEASPGGQIDLDAKGRIYLSSVAGNQVVRMDNDGKNLVVAAKLPDGCIGMAVNPKTGEIAANCSNHQKIFLFTAGGDDKGSTGEAQGLDNYAHWQRYDAHGTLWSSVNDTLVKFGPDGKSVFKLTKADEYDLEGDSAFDVTADGTLYTLANKTLFRISPDGKTARRIAIGPGGKLGQLTEPKSCRVDTNGEVYVSEDRAETLNQAARISVFDREGNFVRAFGRGSQAPLADYPDNYHAGQIYEPKDIAFGPSGRVYLSCSRKAENGAFVMVFQRF